MKLLLLSDTHGKLNQINELVEQTKADSVLHAGDFGFYDQQSVERLSERELNLRVVHSSLPKKEIDHFLKFSLSEKKEFIQDLLPLSDLEEFIQGKKKFLVPVYAVWGNHEDLTVVEKFCQQEYNVSNLHLLYEKQSFHIAPFHLFGLGGNFLTTRKLLDNPLAGNGGKIWSTLSQYRDLIQTVQENSQKEEIRIFVSHVSPGKEPFITLVGVHTKAHISISGHMGTPLGMLWNEFAIRETKLSEELIQQSLAKIKVLIENSEESKKIKFQKIFEYLSKLPEQKINIGRGEKAPWWYREMFYLNLPDAELGYSVLTENQGNITLDSHTQGFRWKKN